MNGKEQEQVIVKAILVIIALGVVLYVIANVHA
jgi:hypothetical protein